MYLPLFELRNSIADDHTECMCVGLLLSYQMYFHIDFFLFLEQRNIELEITGSFKLNCLLILDNVIDQ